MCRIDQLLEQVDQGSQVMAVEPIQITEDIAVPRRDSDLTAWVRLHRLIHSTETHDSGQRSINLVSSPGSDASYDCAGQCHPWLQ